MSRALYGAVHRLPRVPGLFVPCLPLPPFTLAFPWEWPQLPLPLLPSLGEEGREGGREGGREKRREGEKHRGREGARHVVG